MNLIHFYFLSIKKFKKEEINRFEFVKFGFNL